MLGFFHTLQTDPALPAALRASARSWGLCADEFESNKGWPEQVYVREASRLVGDRVFVQGDAWPPTDFKVGSIGMGSYAADGHYSTRGPCIRQAPAPGHGRDVGEIGGCAMATSEEDLQAARANGTLFAGGEGYVGATNEPALYQIPYFALLPKRAEAQNLLCPLTPSASHVTFASLRVEPQFMVLGHAAGAAAAIAAAGGIAVQDVPAAQLHATLIAEGAVLCHEGAPACSKRRASDGGATERSSFAPLRAASTAAAPTLPPPPTTAPLLGLWEVALLAPSNATPFDAASLGTWLEVTSPSGGAAATCCPITKRTGRCGVGGGREEVK